MGDDPTLYEWAGGKSAFDRMINAFYDRVERDELLASFFPGGVHEEHRRNVATWWSEVFGGPAAYTENHGGYEHMLARHHNLAITGEQRLAFVTLLSWVKSFADATAAALSRALSAAHGPRPAR